MSALNIQTTTKRALEETTTETIVVGPGVEVRRVTVVRTGPKGGGKTTQVTEHVTHNHKVKDKNYGQFVVVDPTLVEKLRLQGWFPNDNLYGLIHQEKPFTRVVSGEPYVVVRVKSYDHTLFDVKGKPLPVSVHFDYTNGWVDNRTFDLLRLVAHLNERADVTVHSPSFSPIPHYNQSRGRTTGVSFTWHPDVRTYRRYLKKGGSDYFRRYEAAHTIMGNDKFRRPQRDDDDCDCDEDL